MRIKILLLFLSFTLLACDSEQNDKNDNNIASNSFIHESSGILDNKIVTPEHTVVLHLEATQSHKNDTHQIGIDTFNLHIDSSETREYCFDNDQDAGHRLIIEDSNENIVLEISTGCGSVKFKSGLYVLRLYNANKEDDIEHSVFIYPSVSNDHLQKTENEQDVILRKQNIIGFNICNGCLLNNIDLSHLSFDESSNISFLSPRMNTEYFNHLETTELDFFSTQNDDTYSYKVKPLDLHDSNLFGANLEYSIFNGANFDGVNFENADLSHAVFIDSSFKGANFNNTNLTRAVFIRPDFGINSTLSNEIISQPSVANLYKDNNNEVWGHLTAFLSKGNKLHVNHRIGRVGTSIAPLPNNLRIESSPSIVPNNFHYGSSIFVKANDGFIYEYFNHGNVKHKFNEVPDIGWHKLLGSNTCKTAPDASYQNLNGSDRELYVMVACLDPDGNFKTWHRYFYNKYDDHQNSKYSGWSQTSHHVPRLSVTPDDLEISISNGRFLGYFNIEAMYFSYIKDNKLHIHHNTFNQEVTYTAKDVTGLDDSKFISRSDMLTEWVSQLAIVMDDGNVYRLDGGVFYNYGHPENGIIASPALGGISRDLMVVLSGDGKLYYKQWEQRNDLNWTLLYSEPTDDINSFNFTNNNLTETYFESADFSNRVLSSNMFNNTFFTDVNLENASFDSAELNNVVFDASLLIKTKFKKATLINNYFTNNTDNDAFNLNNKNMIEVDFSQAKIHGITWNNNIAQCTVFDKSIFSNDEVNSSDNLFIGNSDCRTSFVLAKNIPVEFLFNGDDISGQNAFYLRTHNFTSASFKNIKDLSFIGSDMTGAMFGGTASDGVELNNLDASGSIWTDADLSYSFCKNCIFNNSVFTNSCLYQSKMNNSQFENSQWIDTNAASAQFQSSTLNRLIVSHDKSAASCAEADPIPKCDTTQKCATLKNSSFNHSQLNGVDFANINLSKSSFNNAFMTPFTDDDSIQYNANLSGTNLTNTKFKNAIVVCADVSGVDFTNSNFTDARLIGSNLSTPSKDLSGVIFSDAKLCSNNFTGVSITDSDLSGAHFDFATSSINNTEGSPLCTPLLVNVKPETISTTICPDGLNPSTECSLTTTINCLSN